MPTRLTKPRLSTSSIIKLPAEAYKRSYSSQQKKPVFSFHDLQKDHDISVCNKDEKVALVDAIRVWSACTWAEIMNLDRRKNGCEKITNNSFNVPIPYYLQDATFLSFRFGGNAHRMIGYRDEEVFHIIWLDTKLIAYDH